MLEEYLKQDIDNPQYLFHGSPKTLEVLVPQESHDSRGNSNNLATAVFLFPSFLKATPYAFKDSIKELSEGKKWNFEIPNDDSYPLMRMRNVSLDDELVGYIYVFNKDDSMVKDEKSYQYKCFKELKPIDVVTVRYGDFSSYYEVLDSEKVLK